MQNRTYIRAAGFTLIEVMLVLIIFSISMALVITVVGGGISSVEANTAAKKVGAALSHAKTLAVRERTSFSVEVRDATIFIKTGKGIKEELTIPKGISVTTPAKATFFLPSGVSNGGEYMVTGRKGEKFRIKVSSSGRVRIERNG